MQRLHRLYQLLALLIFVLGTSGCAFTNIQLTLPTKQLERPIPGGEGRQIIVVLPFADEREIRDRCGMQKNGYNMDTADAVCMDDPNLWIAHLLREELRRSGFTVLTPGDDHRASALRLDGSLLKIFVEPVIGFWSGSLEADLSVKLRASSETGLVAERTFFVKGWKGGTMVSTTQPYLTALHRATQELTAELVNAILELMEQYPQLGDRGDGLQPMLAGLAYGGTPQ